MLDDPRADALVSNFAGQWLREESDGESRTRSSSVRRMLRQSFLTETALFVTSIFREDRGPARPASGRLRSQRLAEHYLPRV
jgi:hypothetical protein